MANTRNFWTKYPRKKPIPPPMRLPREDECIVRNRAVSLITKYCIGWEGVSTFRNKVNRNLRHALEKWHLTERNGGFIFGELIAWAKQCKPYAECIGKIPHTQTISAAGSATDSAGAPRLVALPDRLEDCHIALVKADRKIADLAQDLQEARRTIEEQRPMVEKYNRLKVPKPKMKTGD